MRWISPSFVVVVIILAVLNYVIAVFELLKVTL